jgi:hypothetical protein
MFNTIRLIDIYGNQYKSLYNLQINYLYKHNTVFIDIKYSV